MGGGNGAPAVGYQEAGMTESVTVSIAGPAVPHQMRLFFFVRCAECPR